MLVTCGCPPSAPTDGSGAKSVMADSTTIMSDHRRVVLLVLNMATPPSPTQVRLKDLPNGGERAEGKRTASRPSLPNSTNSPWDQTTATQARKAVETARLEIPYLRHHLRSELIDALLAL